MRHILTALATLVLASTFPASAAILPIHSVGSNAMLPALGIGDTLVGSVDPDYRPERGDIVIFTHLSQTWIFRVIGMPGETVALRDGRVLIDDEPLAHEDIAEAVPSACPDTMTAEQVCRLKRETLPDGQTYLILDMADGSMSDNTNPTLVPEAHFFLMGDNRDNAQDSRFIGPVPMSQITGKVESILFSTRPGTWPDRLAGFLDAQ
jgi:signal peptidase I